jgi:predicted ATP-dependent endonuclease of OLD family
MRLEAFRVQNFKKVRDTGWVSCGDLVVFVSKKEAGKSAILRAPGRPTEALRHLMRGDRD